MSDDDRSAASFVRGLTIGALLGAAVAGSSLWTRRRRKRAGQTADGNAATSEPGTPPATEGITTPAMPGEPVGSDGQPPALTSA